MSRAADPFDRLAPLYDGVMRHVPYRFWARYVLELTERFGGSAGTVLDLACGTGSVALELARRGCRVVGVDRSRPMLREAARKARGRLALAVADMTRLALAPVFDAAICLFDSLNYVLDWDDLVHVAAGVRAALRPGGWFIADVNTMAAFERELFSQVDLEADAPVPLRWESRYDPIGRLATVEMAFYPRGGEPFAVTHRQRAYDADELESALAAGGLRSAALLEAYTLEPARPDGERWFVVAQADERRG